MDPSNTKLYGKAEDVALQKWYKSSLQGLLEIDVEQQRKNRPSVFVKSQLYVAMEKIASDTDVANGRVYVYCGRPNSGKTSAARALMEIAGRSYMIKRGMFFTKADNVSLTQTVAKHVGAPDTGDLEWVKTLFFALAGKVMVDALDALKNSFFAAFRSCGLAPANEETVVSGIGNEAPIVVFDNVRAISKEDDPFVESVYQLAQATRVHVFVLTDDIQTANNLCRKYGRERIKPLPKFYTGNPTGNDDVQWTEDPWLVPKLSSLIFEHYPRIKTAAAYITDDGQANFVTDGTLPDEALREAAKINKSLHQENRPNVIESEFGFID